MESNSEFSENNVRKKPGERYQTHAKVDFENTVYRLQDKAGWWGVSGANQKLENGRIGTLEAPPQLRTTSERSSGLLSIAWVAWQAALEADRPE